MCDNKNSKPNTLKIHFRYVVGILVAIIIAISALRLSDNQNFTSVISFAGTITSIILSVLAIFITVLSNDSLSNLMERIRGLIDVINPAKNKIDESSNKIEETIKNLDKTESELKETSKSIKEVVGNLESMVIDKFKCMEEKMEKLLSAKSSSNAPFEENCPLNVEAFLSNTSFYGLRLLYCCLLLKESKKPLNLKNFCSIDKSGNELYYAFGFLVAAKSAGYITYNTPNDDTIFEEINCTDALDKEKVKQSMRNSWDLKEANEEIQKIENFCNNA